MKLLQLAFVLLLALPFVSALSVSPDGGFYPGNLNVTLTGSPGNSIYWTTDGTNPLNGSNSTDPIELIQRPLTPSSFATNTETSLYPFVNPTTTLKGTILRAIEVNPSNVIVGRITTTYFIGQSASNYQLPVFSVVLDDADLQDNHTGMMVKGDTYYNGLNATGGNPTDPFRDANWNNDSYRYQAMIELFVNGSRVFNGSTLSYPSGRWSAALAEKSTKHNLNKGIGAKNTNYQFFGNQTQSLTEKIWLKNGGQDFDGLGIRDCTAGLIVASMNVETSKCAEYELYINGEYYGVFNLQEDLDKNYFARKYSIPSKDVVLLSQDGFVEEGNSTDNQAYFALRNWLMNSSTNLSNLAEYNNFTMLVNTESLIDHTIIQMYFANADYPNDFRIWRNKNPATQVFGTPADGRWYFQPKDLDQIAGLYSQINVSDNSIAMWMNKSTTKYEYVMFLKAMESPWFREQFINRNIEVLGTNFNSTRMNQTIDSIADARRTAIPRAVTRWQKPAGFENKLIDYKTWLAKRTPIYTNFVYQLNGTNVSIPPINNTNTSNSTVNLSLIIAQLQLQIAGLQGNLTQCLLMVNGTNTTPPVLPPVIPPNSTNTTNTTLPPSNTTCYPTVSTMPVSCTGGVITSDVVSGCRLITCGVKVVQACDKSGGRFELYHQTWNIPAAKQITVCVGPVGNQTCIKDWGQVSGTRPICG